MIQIEVIYSKPELPEKRVWVAGFGDIVRVDEIDTINHYKKLGVALAFSEKLEVFLLPDYQQEKHNNQII
jgi:hypothetical protein